LTSSQVSELALRFAARVSGDADDRSLLGLVTAVPIFGPFFVVWQLRATLLN